MSDGLPWAKVDSDFPQDTKHRRLERRLPHRDYLAAVGAWMLILADSWRVGSREEGVCADDLLLDQDLLDALQGVHLLDADGRIPRSSWDKWAGAAMEEVRRRAEGHAEVSRKGGKARAAQAVRADRGRFASSRDPAGVQPSAGDRPAGHQPGTSRDPGGTSQDRDREGDGDRDGSSNVLLTKAQLDAWNQFDAVSREGGAPRRWEPVKRAWMGRGLRLPPTAGQREILYEILDSRPMDLPRWIREAPPEIRTGKGIVAHVLDQWHTILREIPKEEPKTPGPMASLGQILAAVKASAG